VLAINGARVIECMLQLVPSVAVFRVAVRLVKHWAQSRGVYGNVLGFPGGVAYAIMVARICQLYPNAAPSLVAARFFSIYARWRWPTPVLLCPLGESPGAMLRVWNPAANPKDRRDLMPVVTPAYPAMCST
jgi:poly(A) polymerase